MALTITTGGITAVGSNNTFSTPSTTQVGDYLLAQVRTTTGYVAPSGWTILTSGLDTNNIMQAIIARVATQAGAVSFTHGGTGASGTVCIHFGGVRSADVIAGTPAQGATAGSITTTGADRLILYFGLSGSNQGGSIPGMTTLYSAAPNAMHWIASAHQAVAGPTGAKTLSGQSGVMTSVLVALAPSTPQAPTVTSPEDNAALNLTEGVPFGWTHNDPEGDAQAGWALKRQAAVLPAKAGDGISYGTEEWWNETAQDVLSTKTVGATTTSTATAYSNQRKVDRCQNGVLWTCFYAAPQSTTAAYEFWYSTDNGSTWNNSNSHIGFLSTFNTGAPVSIAMFIDLDDYCHVVYKDLADEKTRYRRGTPNAARTAWTWSATTVLHDNTYGAFDDLVAHREGTGWRVHIVEGVGSNVNGYVLYYPITVTSAGVITKGTTVNLTGSFDNTYRPFPSIDFNHTGDGKTVAGGTPHLYVGWTSNGTGAGKGIRFKKATYSAGPTWTWGTEQEIDNTRFVSANQDWMNCLFDGTRVVMGGSFSPGSDIVLYERDVADTATVTRVLVAGPSTTAQLHYGGLTYDSGGSVYLFGRNAVAPHPIRYHKWDRATTTYGPGVQIDTATSSTPYVSAKRGFSDYRIEFVYTDGTSPYNVNYGSVLLAPATSWVTGEVTNAGTATSKTITSWPADDATYRFALATADAGGLGAYSAWRTLNPWEWWDPGLTAGAVAQSPTTITTSTAATATAYSNQRKVDRCQNGVLWMIMADPTNVGNGMRLAHSTDDGATWTIGSDVLNGSGSTTNTYTRSASLFIDLDDYAHVVFKDNGDGYIYYRRGTPNAARTAWTWSAATLVFDHSYAAAGGDYPDVVAHREGTGWAVHVVISLNTNTQDRVIYKRLTITSGGTVSVVQGSANINDSLAATPYGNTVHKYPSIDFNHTGDGKTVAGGTPHLFVAWSAGTTGAGKGIRFRKATYSGGAWTWGTEQEIDSTLYIASAATWLNCLFDGTRVVMAGFLYNGSTYSVVIHDRDTADTATVTRAPLTGLAGSSADNTAFGSATYDSDGNVHIFGRNSDEGAGVNDLVYRKWTRSGASLGAEVVIDSGVGDPYVSTKRGFSNNRIEFVFTDGTASPYNVNYGSIVAADVAPGWALMEEFLVASAVTEHAAVGTDFEGKTYQWAVATTDTAGAASPYASDFQFSFTAFERWGAVFI